MTVPSVSLIAAPVLHVPDGIPWQSTDGATDAEALTEFAGRASFHTFDRPNPLTADNTAFLRHVMETGNGDLLKHATVTVFVTGITRAACHDVATFGPLTVTSTTTGRGAPRGRSDASFEEPVIPADVADDEQLVRLVRESFRDAQFVYDELFQAVEDLLADEPNPLVRAQRARQVARVVLPDGTKSSVVVTGSLRDWRDFIMTRGSKHRDREMQAIAVECLRAVSPVAPVLFDDLYVAALDDGTEVVEQPLD